MPGEVEKPMRRTTPDFGPAAYGDVVLTQASDILEAKEYHQTMAALERLARARRAGPSEDLLVS